MIDWLLWFYSITGAFVGYFITTWVLDKVMKRYKPKQPCSTCYYEKMCGKVTPDEICYKPKEKQHYQIMMQQKKIIYPER